MRESFVFIVGKPVDEPSDVAMSLHDSLSRMPCKRKYLIKMMAVKAGQRKKRRGVLYIISASAVEGRLLVHAGLATETEIISPHVWNSYPICTNSRICLCLSNDDEHVCCHAALLCLWLQPTKAIGLHDGGQRYLLPIDCYKPTCYMYGPSLSITERSVDMCTVHSFKNKLN